jgi:copper chaperone
MEKALLHVEGMACEHCANTVKAVSGSVKSVQDVTVDLQSGTVVLTYDGNPETLQAVRTAIEEQDYKVLD